MKNYDVVRSRHARYYLGHVRKLIAEGLWGDFDLNRRQLEEAWEYASQLSNDEQLVRDFALLGWQLFESRETYWRNQLDRMIDEAHESVLTRHETAQQFDNAAANTQLSHMVDTINSIRKDQKELLRAFGTLRTSVDRSVSTAAISQSVVVTGDNNVIFTQDDEQPARGQRE